MPSSTRRLHAANIKWLDNDTPFSIEFDDIYYSVESGVAESRHNFIDGNDLSNRFAACEQNFCVAELGFGCLLYTSPSPRDRG